MNPMAAVLMVLSWGIIAVTTVWCFYRLLTEKKK